ncbi:endonuclease/exonuclease/phosphatase family protein [Entomospira entomophila]|uniref:Endonuclease/exonuclease/phosphatase family protein n=1 Tax=Entomospira entomophila TaxID=2719988 RepID=A0A968KR49_9SPIO|nr:endonuclease/exonuclease/phosphatase family protein [Entomospira entomophilus]NIZ40378.1 endonuclease/exonuclease/phosphatase family protein [Entomospira entomophilus]WDI35937.1 endonuclease/exonuclease/phosphatase family protein [Entomospira entomophilus]
MFQLKYRYLIVLIFVGLIGQSCALFRSELNFVTYNVQNLFDDSYDGSEYREFQEVNPQLYAQKLSNIAGGIDRISQKYGSIDFLLLQEVENNHVVRDLMEQTRYLQGMHMIFAKEPSHATGIAILSRYPVDEVMSVQILDPLQEQTYLRPLLIGVIRFNHDRVIALINVHLQSQRDQKNRIRRDATWTQLHLAIERLRHQYGAQLSIIIGGDFNTDLSQIEDSNSPIIGIRSDKTALHPDEFYNDWPSHITAIKESDSPVFGSYFYGDRWQSLDGFLVSGNLLSNANISFLRQEPIQLEYFLEQYQRENSEEIIVKPKAFYQNRIDGVSDHLPVIAIFKYNR